MKCLDTDLLVAILRGEPKAQGKMKELDNEERPSTTSVNAFELFYGAHLSKKIDENVQETRRLLGRLNLFSFDLSSSEKAGEIVAGLESKGRIVEYRDVMIASIALTNGLTLVTRNKEHFSRINGLGVEPW